MTRMLSVDPGVDGCGVAAWEAGLLVRAEYVRAKLGVDVEHSMLDWELAAWCVWRDHATDGNVKELVLEHPQVYAKRLNTDPADLITLALLGGAVAGLFRVENPALRVVTYLPAEHKGQVPKPKKSTDPYIIAERAKKRLSPAELERVESCAPSLAHNVWDAIWLGLHYQGRTR